MPVFSRLAAVALCVALVGPMAPIEARGRKGEKVFTQGRAFEAKKDWDAALDAYRKALDADPSDIQYQMAAQRVQAQAAQVHLEQGIKIRKEGRLGDALIEFQRAFGTDPGLTAAVQEIKTTQEMIERERERVLKTGKESSPEERALTPLQRLKQEQEEQLNRILPTPELKTLGPARFDLQISSNVPKTLYETLGAYTGINVLWDPQYQNTTQIKTPSVNFQNSTLEEALDYIALVTHTFWKPISSNTIFIAEDSRNKRTEYADQAVKVFYLQNNQTQQELQEVVNAVRTVSDAQRMFPLSGQNAILARGDADQIALVGKLVHDLDRPKAEVVVDIVVMQTSSTYSRQLAAALAPTGLNVPFNFTPRAGLQTPTTTTSGGEAANGGGSGSSSPFVPLANLARLSTADWSTTLPSALLQAVMSDANTKVLQSPRLRSVDNMKATLNIGDRQPIATGSFQPGIGGVGINPLVNTQFQYLDVGVNVALTPRVQEDGDVSLHVELDVSNVSGKVNLGGIDQPIISQKKIVHDIRMREGEVNLLGGLINEQETKSVTGIPGLSSIPLLRRLFTGDSVEKQRSELLIALVPHVVRRPDISAASLRAVDVGTQNAFQLRYSPKDGAETPDSVGQPKLEVPGTTPGQAQRPGAQQAAPAQRGAAPSGPPSANSVPLPLQQLIRPNAPPLGAAPPAATPPGAAPGATAATVNASTHLEPARVEAAANGAFTVSLMLDGGSDVAAAAPIQIQYDPKMLSLTDIAPGDLFSRGGGSPAFSRSIQNDVGLATVQQLSRPAGAPGVSAPGTLLTLRFQALGRGITTVRALNVTVRNSQGMAIGSSNPQTAVTIK